MSRILLAYATRNNSTREVAEYMAAALREVGHEVDVQVAAKVRSLDGYHMVILGAPIYVGSWLKPAHNFLKHHQSALAQAPIAIFALGPLHDDPKEFEETRPSFDQALAKYEWLHPVSTGYFVGSLDPETLRFPDSLLTTMKGSPLYGLGKLDERNWEALKTWASQAAEAALPVPQ